MKLNLFYNCTISGLTQTSLGHLIKNDSSSTPFAIRSSWLPSFQGSFCRLWPNGIVPYVLETGYESSPHFNDEFAQNVNKAFQVFNNESCVRLVPRNGSHIRDFLVIMFAKNCSGNYGRNGGPQLFAVGPDCHRVDSILHQLLLAIGITTDLR